MSGLSNPMKATLFIVTIFLLFACGKEDEPVPQLTANFASTLIGIASSEQDRSVSIELNRIPLLPTTVEVKLTNAAGTAYGVDYMTNPVAVNDTIEVAFPLGSSMSVLSITKLKVAEDHEQRSFDLTIISVSNNGLPGSNNTLKVDLE